ncbi:MAG: transposon DNA-invertase [Burkholderiales bacterium]|jgi:DNA invertase Pin-like site-specific DNA recombinase|nr:transposon DNA-invertase [Burkholderiales bacterium]
MRFGYARVSTLEQNLSLQVDALKVAGCDEIITDESSGKNANRPGLTNLLNNKLRSGDEFIVWRLDRLGRSLKDLIELINDFENKGIKFNSLTENINTSTTSGKLIFNIFASLAEFERNLIRERTVAGLSAARSRGRLGGRPKVANTKINAAVQLYNQKELTINEICKTIGISKATLYSI